VRGAKPRTPDPTKRSTVASRMPPTAAFYCLAWSGTLEVIQVALLGQVTRLRHARNILEFSATEYHLFRWYLQDY
jgi:hypothetical protein